MKTLPFSIALICCIPGIIIGFIYDGRRNNELARLKQDLAEMTQGRRQDFNTSADLLAKESKEQVSLREKIDQYETKLGLRWTGSAAAIGSDTNTTLKFATFVTGVAETNYPVIKYGPEFSVTGGRGHATIILENEPSNYQINQKIKELNEMLVNGKFLETNLAYITLNTNLVLRGVYNEKEARHIFKFMPRLTEEEKRQRAIENKMKGEGVVIHNDFEFE